jgi:hypothetical protein
VAAVLASVNPALAGCLGRIDAITTQTPLRYDPFARQDFATNLIATIRNTGNTACTYAIDIEGAATTPKFGGTIGYTLAGPARPSNLGLIASQTTNTIRPGAQATVSIPLTIPKAQNVIAGNYSDRLRVKLRAPEASTGQPPYDRRHLVLTCSVPPLFQINIGGAGLTTTVDFGELTKGERRSVVIQTRATQDYALRLSSKNAGALILDDATAKWQVPYLAYIDGHPVNFSTGMPVKYQRRQYEDSHRLTIVIGDPQYKKAGLYKDIITILVTSGI